ncbi:MAG: G5 domain-containing protein, partial [Finegoldia magna]
MKNKRTILNRFLCMVMAFMIVFTTVFTSDLTRKNTSQAAGSFPFSSYNGSINYNGSGLDVRFEGTFGRTVRKGEKIYFTARPTEFTRGDEQASVKDGGIPSGFAELRNKIVYDVNSGRELGRFINRSDFIASIDIPAGSKMRFEIDDASVMAPSTINNIDKTYTYQEGLYVEDKLIDKTTVTAVTKNVNYAGGVVIYTTILDKNKRPVILDLKTRIGKVDLASNNSDIFSLNIPLNFKNRSNVLRTIELEISEWEKLKSLADSGRKLKKVINIDTRGNYTYDSLGLSSYDIKQKIKNLESAKTRIQSSMEDISDVGIRELTDMFNDRRNNFMGNDITCRKADLTEEVIFQFALKGKSGVDLSFIKNIPKSYFLDTDNVIVAQTYQSSRLSNGLQFDNGLPTDIKDIDIRLNENNNVALINIKFDMKVGMSNVALAKFNIPIPSNIGFFNGLNKPNLEYNEFMPNQRETKYAFAAGYNFDGRKWENFKNRDSMFLDGGDGFPFLTDKYDSVSMVPRIVTRTVQTNLDGELVGTTPIPFNKRRVPSEDLEVGKERLKQKGEEGAKRYDGTIVKQPKDEITEYGVRKTVVNTETRNKPYKEIRRPNENLNEGETRTIQQGQVGKQTRKSTTVVNSETGKTISGPTYTNWTTTTQPKDKIIEYGVRKTVVKTETKDIPFKEIRRPADDLEEGKTRVVQQGQVGKQTRKSTTVVN